MTSQTESKVWICTADSFDDYRIIRVYAKKEDADEWFKQACKLDSSVTYADFDKSMKAAKKKKAEFEKLGLEHQEFDYGKNIREFEVVNNV